MSVALDWDEVHRRLAAAEAAIRDKWEPDRDEVARILRERAKGLATETENADPADYLEILEFQLAWERYAIESFHVREVFPLERLTPLPCTPDFVLGIANVRGEMISVVDIKKFFGLPQKGLGDLNKLIVLESPAMGFGILADAVLGMRRIPRDDIQPPLPTFSGIGEDYLHGVAYGHTIVLDAQKLMGDTRMVVREEIIG